MVAALADLFKSLGFGGHQVVAPTPLREALSAMNADLFRIGTPLSNAQALLPFTLQQPS